MRLLLTIFLISLIVMFLNPVFLIVAGISFFLLLMAMIWG